MRAAGTVITITRIMVMITIIIPIMRITVTPAITATIIPTATCMATRTTMPMIMGTTIITAMLERSPSSERSLTMSDDTVRMALLRLMTWLSPSYPVGAFAYSSGLEWTIEAGDVRDEASLREWIASFLKFGPAKSDAILFAETWRAVAAQDFARLRDVAELAAAFAPSQERHLETTAQGRAFMDVTRAAWHCVALDDLTKVWDGDIAYPVAVATACAGHAIALDPALAAFTHALVVNWISAGVRLIPLGQTASQKVLASLEAEIAACALRTASATLYDLGSATFRADLSSMLHETQYTRLFRS